MGFWGSFSGKRNLRDLGIKWEARRGDYWGSKSSEESEFC